MGTGENVELSINWTSQTELWKTHGRWNVYMSWKETVKTSKKPTRDQKSHEEVTYQDKKRWRATKMTWEEDNKRKPKEVTCYPKTTKALMHRREPKSSLDTWHRAREDCWHTPLTKLRKTSFQCRNLSLRLNFFLALSPEKDKNVPVSVFPLLCGCPK